MFTFLGKLWKVVTAIRTGLANIIFLAIILLIVFAIFNTNKPGLPDKAPLLVNISGALVDRKTYEPSMFDFIGGQIENPETLVRDVTYAIKQSADDPRITGLVLNLNHLHSANFSKLEEIGQAIDMFRNSDKPVIAYADTFSQQQYFLASFADEIYLNNMGNIALTGFGIYQSYYKEAADKLALKFHLFKVGNFKDAAEPYVRNSMSQASREHKSSLITSLWQRYTGIIEERRRLSPGAISSFIQGFQETLKNTDDDFATVSKDAGLVDHVVSRVELNQQLINKFGKDKDGDYFKAIGYQQYIQYKKPAFPQPSNNIGLLVATGTIVDGQGNEGQIGGNSFSALVREAVNDQSLAALIIRIDSGGGSAFASEVIRDELRHAKASGLPIYVSMGSVAASGGYWMATVADEIWALPSTITGSIGVWGLIPNVSDSLKKIGIHNDGLGTTALSDIYQIDRPLSQEAQQVFQSGVDNVYKQFINLVANARGKTAEDVHTVAQGRVWTGEKAKEFGLIDQLGSLDDLVVAIGEKQQLDTFQLKVIEPPLSTSEQFMRALLEQTKGFSMTIRSMVLGEDIATMMDYLPKEELTRITGSASHRGIRYLAECLTCEAP